MFGRAEKQKLASGGDIIGCSVIYLAESDRAVDSKTLFENVVRCTGGQQLYVPKDRFEQALDIAIDKGIISKQSIEGSEVQYQLTGSGKDFAQYEKEHVEHKHKLT